MHAELKPFLDWLHAHPQIAGLLAFLIAFLESLAVVGLLLPGTIIMTAIGTLIGSGILPFTSVAIWSIAGAICGDVLSFWLGAFYKEKIREFWPFRKHPQWLAKGESFFQRHGGKGVFLGRFVGPIRPIMPLIAGMMSMPGLRFLIVDIISGILWAPLYLLPGILLGYASQALPPELATKLIMLVIAVLIILWCISWLLKSVYYKLRAYAASLLAYIWQIIIQHPKSSFIRILLIDPARPQSHRQLALAIAFSVGFLLFLLLTLNVFEHWFLTAANYPVYHFLRGLRAGGLDQFFVAITFIGEAPVMFFMWSAVAIYLLIANRHAAKYWIANGLMASIGEQTIKWLIKSPRPTGLLDGPHSWSFPSGHSTLSMAMLGFLAILLSEKRSETIRNWIFLITALFILTIGFSRLYLGAHWLTDVAGGWLLGFLCISLVTIFYRRQENSLAASARLLLTAFITLLLAWSAYFYVHYTRTLQNYLPVWNVHTLDEKNWWSQEIISKPVYRNNRFGKPVEILNVQWAGNLNNIEKSLTQHGWNLLPRPNLLLTLQGLANFRQNQEVPPPILTQLYEDRNPVLVMVKNPVNQPSLLVLRLWDAHIRLSNNQKLWMGAISYHRPWRASFLNRHKHHHASQQPIPLPLPTDVLSNDLAAFAWKKIPFEDDDLQISLNENSDKNILLIKPLSAN